MNDETKKSNAKILRGIVVSNKMQRTVVVRIDRRIKHPLYGKIITRSTKLHAHVAENLVCNEGDMVAIQECRPISKLKTWVVLEVISKLNNVAT